MTRKEKKKLDKARNPKQEKVMPWVPPTSEKQSMEASEVIIKQIKDS